MTVTRTLEKQHNLERLRKDYASRFVSVTIFGYFYKKVTKEFILIIDPLVKPTDSWIYPSAALNIPGDFGDIIL